MKKYTITVNGTAYEVEVEEAGVVASAPKAAPKAAPAPAAAPAGSGDPVSAPMPGKILDVRCKNGQAVKSGDVLFILEAMKMENEIFAGKDGTVTSVCVDVGATVDTGAVLATVQ